jgi:hypothetical protein
MPQDEHSTSTDQDMERRATFNRAVLDAAEYLTCPHCGQSCRLSDTTCPRCGTLFENVLEYEEDDKTFTVAAELTAQSNGDKSWPRVGAIPQMSVTVVFDVGNRSFTLPNQEIVIIGRGSATSDEPEAYIDLGHFDARDKGVSRQHVKILRKDTLIYVVDLDSMNGTWLNGRRLRKYVERLLRNGDELQLGSLKLRVKFI